MPPARRAKGFGGDDDDDDDEEDENDYNFSEEEYEEDHNECPLDSDDDFVGPPRPPKDLTPAVTPPRRRRVAVGGGERAGGRARVRAPARDPGWVAIACGACVPVDDVPNLLSKHFVDYAAGRGFTQTGPSDVRGANNTLVTKYRCNYTGCPAMVRVVRSGTDDIGMAAVEKTTAADFRHNDHIGDIDKRGVPGYVRAVLSPSKCMKKPFGLRMWLRKNHPSIVIDEDLKKKLIYMHEDYMKRLKHKSLQNSAGPGTYGGLAAKLEPLQYDNVRACECFSEDSVYVVGPHYINAAEKRVAFVLSTDNMLLNAYRQSVQGLPSYLQIDTTHRLTFEKHCMMPITTAGPTQRAHVIAYGVCSSEDWCAHRFVIQNTKNGIERIVNERARNRERV